MVTHATRLEKRTILLCKKDRYAKWKRVTSWKGLATATATYGHHLMGEEMVYKLDSGFYMIHTEISYMATGTKRIRAELSCFGKNLVAQTAHSFVMCDRDKLKGEKLFFDRRIRDLQSDISLALNSENPESLVKEEQP